MNSRASAKTFPPAQIGAARRPLALREVPAAERPRERLRLRGAAGLTTAELVALVWGSGSRGMNAVDLAERSWHDSMASTALPARAPRSSRRRPAWVRHARLSSKPRSSSAEGCWPIGPPGAGRSARRAMSRTGSYCRWAAWSARSCGPSSSTPRTWSSRRSGERLGAARTEELTANAVRRSQFEVTPMRGQRDTPDGHAHNVNSEGPSLRVLTSRRVRKAKQVRYPAFMGED